MPQQEMYAVYPERRYLPAKVRVFIEFLIEKIGQQQPYWDRGIIPARSFVDSHPGQTAAPRHHSEYQG